MAPKSLSELLSRSLKTKTEGFLIKILNSICLLGDMQSVGGITPVTATKKRIRAVVASGSDVQACSAYCRILFGPYDTQQYDPLVLFTLLCLLGQVRSSLGSIILACYCFWIAVVTGLYPSPSSSSDSRLLGENAAHKPWWKCSQLLIK